MYVAAGTVDLWVLVHSVSTVTWAAYTYTVTNEFILIVLDGFAKDHEFSIRCPKTCYYQKTVHLLAYGVRPSPQTFAIFPDFHHMR